MRKFRTMFLILVTFALTANIAFGQFWLENNYQSFPTNNQFKLLNDYRTKLKKDNDPAAVERVQLSQTVVFDDCNNIEGRCSENKETIDVYVEAYNPQNDVLTYNYIVSGGKIIGKGENVIWDLSDAKLGAYTITARVDGSCGVCSGPKTEVVSVIDCPKELSKNYPPNFITQLFFEKNEIRELCKLGSKKCFQHLEKIKVSTKTLGTDKNKLNYKYEVSGGKIFGNGADVKWDLSGVQPGNYTITSSVDEGRGYCQKPVSETVVVLKYKKSKK